MKPAARPATPLVPTTAQPVTAPTSAARYPAATTPPPPAARPVADEEDEAVSVARRDFYAWCAGCEGFGSIF